MKLEPHEIDSALWKRLKAHQESDLATLRERNDQNHDPIKTAELRGRIKQIKEFLSLERTAEQAPDDAEKAPFGFQDGP